MDLLCRAYSSLSDDELESTQPLKLRNVGNGFPPPKRPEPDVFLKETSRPGRYISKRERAISCQTVLPPAPSDSPNAQVVPSLALGSISDSVVPGGMLSSMRRSNAHAIPLHFSKWVPTALHFHKSAVSALSWSQTHVHLLASAGMDEAICVWNVWSRERKLARVFRFHNKAVKDVKWSPSGLALLSCGYDCASRLIDVEKQMETRVFKEDQVVTAIKFHPRDANLFLSGGSRGGLHLWDARTGKVLHQYSRPLGSILDVEFTINGKQFISSSDVSAGNVSENSITVWDVSRQVPLSNQVYTEAYTCPSVRCHPYDQVFVAQSNGNYIAIFSSIAPFRMNKYKRYEGHWVSGFPVRCSFSVDGEKLVSGSSDGSLYVYSYRTSRLLGTVKAYELPCVDVAFHPSMPNVIASCSWHGEVSVFDGSPSFETIT